MGRFAGIGMVSAESFAGGECVPALRFLADFAIGCRPLDLVLADQAAMQVKAVVTPLVQNASRSLLVGAGSRMRQWRHFFRISVSLKSTI